MKTPDERREWPRRNILKQTAKRFVERKNVLSKGKTFCEEPHFGEAVVEPMEVSEVDISLTSKILFSSIVGEAGGEEALEIMN